MATELRPKCPKCGRVMMRGVDTRGKKRWRCIVGKVYCYSTVGDPSAAKKQDGSTVKKGPPPKFKRKLDSKIFVVTAAQNATPLHEGFWNSLLQYCEFRGAELMVIPIRYKNPTSRWTESQANEEWWLDRPAVDEMGIHYPGPNHKYLWNVRKALNKNISVLGDIKVQPTAVSPLTGFEGLTHGESAILGHTKLQLKVIATPQGKYPKILTTTGACTVKNYTDTRAGKLGDFHHTLGAAVVEVDGPRFHLRQINATKDGSFYDIVNGIVMLFNERGAVNANDGIPALVMGDTHVEGIDPDVERATFQEIIPQLKPKKIFWHDLEDGGSVNHWAAKNPFVTGARYYSEAGSASEEFYGALDFVTERTPKDATSYIVASNHNDWLHRWILDRDWKTLSPKDRGFYLKVASKLYEQTKLINGDDAEKLNAFIMLAKEHFAKAGGNVRVLEYEESAMVEGVECGMHGHYGANGSRGSAKSFSRIGVKSITGHVHTPAIEEGCYQVGTSTKLTRGYTHGPSSWLNTHCLIYPNGKRSLINIIDGRWRL
jgi:hypothetical protein